MINSDIWIHTGKKIRMFGIMAIMQPLMKMGSGIFWAEVMIPLRWGENAWDQQGNLRYTRNYDEDASPQPIE